MGALSVKRVLDRFPFRDHPGFRYDRNIEGYRDYTFGCRAGPEVDGRNLLHELGHAVEFGPDQFKSRCRYGHFRFRIPKVWIYGEPYDNFSTCLATKRELRAIAWQGRLAQGIMAEKEVQQMLDHFAEVMVWMPDEINIPGDTEQERISWCREMIQKQYDAYTTQEAYRRLEGWLDRTAAELRRKAKREARLTQ